MTKDTKRTPMKVVKNDKKKPYGLTADEAIKNLQLSLSEKDELNKYKTVLIHADWNCATGFGMVMKKLMEQWLKNENWIFFILGINDPTGKEYEEHERIYVFPALPNDDNNEPFGRIKLLQKLYLLNVDYLFCLNDPEVLNPIGKELDKINKKKKKQGRKQFKSVAYMPVDSEIRPVDADKLAWFDEICTYTHYAKVNFQNVLKKSKEIHVVPHGMDPKDFFEDKKGREKARKKLLGKNHNDKFLIGTVNRNQPRKDVGTLLLSFKEFLKSEPEAILYLHMNPTDSVGLNIERACSRIGLKYRTNVLVPKDFNENEGVSLKELNDIYNAMDCFVTTTTAEGWGLTVTEAMATKTPVVCPLHTSLPEVTGLGNVFGYTNLEERFFVHDYEKVRYVSDPMVVAHNIFKVYEMLNGNSKAKQKLSKKVHEAQKFIYKRQWKQIADYMFNLFN